MSLYGLRTQQSIIDVESARHFWEEVERFTDERRDRVIRHNLRATIESMRHKLNIMRYNAGLIQELSEDDYTKFSNPLFPDRPFVSTITYQDRCLFEMHNNFEYRLFLTLFVENFSAASFSLFDVCGYLLSHLFSLPTSHDVSYKTTLDSSKIQGYTALYDFLYRYRPTTRSGNASPNQVNWIDPLSKLRNHLTHQPITNIFRADTDNDVYNPTIRAFLINKSLFNQQQDKELKAFVEECFDGTEDFVSQLYERLIIEIQTARSVPI